MNQEKKSKGRKPQKKNAPVSKQVRDVAYDTSKTRLKPGVDARYSYTEHNGVAQNNPYHQKEHGQVRHPTLGIPGIRVTGCQPMIHMYSTSGLAYGLQSVSGYGTIYDGAHQYLQPMWLGGPLMYRALSYEHYVFRRIKLKYTATVSPNTSGINVAVASCISADSNPDTNIPNSFTENRCVTPSITATLWVPTWDLEYKYNGPKIWFVSANASDSVAANIRDETQATLCSNFSTSTSASLTVGVLDIEYEMELYNPTFVLATSTLLKSLTFNMDKSKKSEVKALIDGVLDKVKELKECKKEDEASEYSQPPPAVTHAPQPSYIPVYYQPPTKVKVTQS